MPLGVYRCSLPLFFYESGAVQRSFAPWPLPLVHPMVGDLLGVGIGCLLTRENEVRRDHERHHSGHTSVKISHLRLRTPAPHNGEGLNLNTVIFIAHGCHRDLLGWVPEVELTSLQIGWRIPRFTAGSICSASRPSLSSAAGHAWAQRPYDLDRRSDYLGLTRSRAARARGYLGNEALNVLPYRSLTPHPRPLGRSLHSGASAVAEFVDGWPKRVFTRSTAGSLVLPLHDDWHAFAALLFDGKVLPDAPDWSPEKSRMSSWPRFCSLWVPSASKEVPSTIRVIP
jgi:hypothetical protein